MRRGEGVEGRLVITVEVAVVVGAGYRCDSTIVAPDQLERPSKGKRGGGPSTRSQKSCTQKK